jgi:hypothetical protein
VQFGSANSAAATSLVSLPPGPKTSKDFIGRNGPNFPRFIRRKSPLSLFGPKSVGLLFRNFFEAVEELARQFSTSGKRKVESFRDKILELPSHTT